MDSRAIHGGQFWEARGDEFETPASRVINADVLDAWFEPPSRLREGMAAILGEALMTSPPTYAEGAERVWAAHRRVSAESMIIGPGSSALIHLAWQTWGFAGMKVLVLEPTYSEYRHVTEELRRGTVLTHCLDADTGFAFDTDRWLEDVHRIQPDIAVLVNPNNPTGTQVDVERVLLDLPKETLLWVDEAYLDYTGLQLAETLAANHPELVVLKTLSKVYGLSGLRVASMVGHPARLTALRYRIPPWWVSFPAQWAVTQLPTLADYPALWAETQCLRQEMVSHLEGVPLRLLASEANWILLELDKPWTSTAFVGLLATKGIFIRDASLSATSLSRRCIRIAVKDRPDQEAIVAAMKDLLFGR